MKRVLGSAIARPLAIIVAALSCGLIYGCCCSSHRSHSDYIIVHRHGVYVERLSDEVRQMKKLCADSGFPMTDTPILERKYNDDIFFDITIRASEEPPDQAYRHRCEDLQAKIHATTNACEGRAKIQLL